MPISSQAWLSLTEFPRAGLEISSLFSAAPFLSFSKRGDGHPVMVIPGFLADDDSTWVIRQFLERLGYQTHPWDQQRNLGVTAMGGYETLVQQVLRIHRESGQKVSIVGWSLGGVHALAVAHRAEYAVRSVITLGSPITPPKADGSDTPPIALAMRRAARAMNATPLNNGNAAPLNGRHVLQELSENLPVSSIFSRTDSVVPWRRSQLPAGPQRENIEVVASHIGLGFNPTVLFAMADRLAQPKGEFTPFQRYGVRQLLYPNPARPAVL